MDDPRLLRLHAADNVLTVIQQIGAGETIEVDGARVLHEVALVLGHKVAARRIAAGEKVIKYGAPIGSASCEIAAGEHVHTHNLQSDYIPTYLRNEQDRLFAQQHAL